VNVLVSVDAGTRDVHRKIKRVESFDSVWNNLELYAEAQIEPFKNVKSKYVIVPGINDTQKEIALWLAKSHSIGLKNVVLNLDYNWLQKNIKDIPSSLYNLILYAQKEAEKLGMFCELYGETFKVRCEVEHCVPYNKAGFFDD
jgi:pyruvate-formate lyase-activating enzyme